MSEGQVSGELVERKKKSILTSGLIHVETDMASVHILELRLKNALSSESNMVIYVLWEFILASTRRSVGIGGEQGSEGESCLQSNELAIASMV